MRENRASGARLRSEWPRRDGFGTNGWPHKTLEADALIGADGIRSRLRQLMNPSEGDVHWGGAIMWRGVTRATHSNRRIVCGDWLSQSALCVLPHIAAGPSNRARRIELDRRDYGREQRRVEQGRLESVGRRGRRACSL